MQIMGYEEDFFEAMEKTDRALVLYGTGNVAKTIYPYMEKVQYVCDQKADGELLFHGLPVKRPEELELLSEPLVILICIGDSTVSSAIRSTLEKFDMDAVVYEYCNNCAFLKFTPLVYESTRKEIKYVRLVCRDAGWILSKFANRMKEYLQLKGVRAEIGDGVDPNADINHHIAFHIYEPVKDCADTLMITHVDSLNKINLLKHQLQIARMGICMSRETMSMLSEYGVPREKLCYINPAQDGVIKPQKYTLGITHKNYIEIDGRKRPDALLDICKAIDPLYFKFKIMGSGWDDIVGKMRKEGFEVEYYEEFDYDIYTNLIPSLDYYLYWGFDEGSMGYLDAMRAGIGTIVTPQGYHLDIKDGITYPCRVIADFVDVLLELQDQRKRRVDSVKEWTWSKYVDKHLEVWKYLLGADAAIYDNKHVYEDGIFSVLRVNA